jgi:hypothetical protein
VFVLELTALFRRFCFFLGHFKSPVELSPTTRKAVKLGLRYSLITPQKIARPLLSLMHASDESQSPGLGIKVNAPNHESQ